MKNREIILNWLKRARSNLERAKMGKVTQGILYEDLCFDAQQAVEICQGDCQGDGSSDNKI